MDRRQQQQSNLSIHCFIYSFADSIGKLALQRACVLAKWMQNFSGPQQTDIIRRTRSYVPLKIWLVQTAFANDAFDVSVRSESWIGDCTSDGNSPKCCNNLNRSLLISLLSILSKHAHAARWKTDSKIRHKSTKSTRELWIFANVVQLMLLLLLLLPSGIHNCISGPSSAAAAATAP